MLTFLVLNRIEPTLTVEQLFEWTLRVAIGKLDRPGLATLLREHSRPVKR
jgi:death-on-curing protein